jgi:beta-1,4-mannosyltransferase
MARAHRPMTDSQLWDHLFSLDVSVVPPLFGSHSIWPEACHDLGTSLVLPSTSHAAQQRPCLTYSSADGHVPDVATLRDAIVAARAAEAPWRADPTERWKERVGIAESLRGLYEKLLGMRR